jgi:peptide/nickel transport system ATP-binding protein
MSEPVLRIEDLRVSFATRAGRLRAVDGIGFEVHAGETLGIVGESGCGKSVTALAVLRLLPEPPARIDSGHVWFGGEDLLALPIERLRKIRGSGIAMIFQEPMTALNPVFRIGDQIEEALEVHTELDAKARQARVVELLDLVGIPDPASRARAYPHQLSGGMRQRAMIAMALACNPSVLIADEPTTALDVTIQAQILRLIDELKRRLHMAVLLITHDLGIVAESAQRVAVVYAGRVIETGPAAELLRAPRHPYTEGLLAALPSTLAERRSALRVIPGSVPDLAARPSGCAFRARCPRADAYCVEHDPALEPDGPERAVACHHPVPWPQRAEAGEAHA